LQRTSQLMCSLWSNTNSVSVMAALQCYTKWGDAHEHSHRKAGMHNASTPPSQGLSAAAFITRAVCSCPHALVLLCSAGKRVPWLSLSQQHILLPANGSETINLTYNADDMAAGTYRAQLCLFSDFSYGRHGFRLCAFCASEPGLHAED